MAQATKIVIHFDDGSSHEVDLSQYAAVFTSETRAKKCGHNPPYGKPPKNDDAGSATLMSASTSGASEYGGTCYYVNGVIVCN